jgi:hypothetical protein
MNNTSLSCSMTQSLATFSPVPIWCEGRGRWASEAVCSGWKRRTPCTFSRPTRSQLRYWAKLVSVYYASCCVLYKCRISPSTQQIQVHSFCSRFPRLSCNFITIKVYKITQLCYMKLFTTCFGFIQPSSGEPELLAGNCCVLITFLV